MTITAVRSRQRPAQLAVPPVQTVQADPDLAQVLAKKDEKDFSDLRDRAAYVHATGALPTHLRSYFTNLLRKATRYSRTPVSLDGRIGSMKVMEETIQALALDEHPLIRKVRSFVEQGYMIRVSREVNDRKPFTKVFLFRDGAAGQERITVQTDGSVKEGWA